MQQQTDLFQRGENYKKSPAIALSSLYRFGWAFLLAWVFCVFYTSSLAGYGGSAAAEASTPLSLAAMAPQLYYAAFPLLMSVITLVAIVAGEHRFGSPASHRTCRVAAPLLTAISTFALFFPSLNPVFDAVAFTLGAILTGIGSGALWVMWGEYYALLDQEEVEFITPVSAIIAVVLVLGISSMYGWVQLAVVISLPLISGGCLYLALTHFGEGKNPLLAHDDTSATGAGAASDATAHDAEATANAGAKNHITAGPIDALKLFGREGLAIFTACAIICFMGTISEATAPATVFTLQGALAFSALLMGGVAFYSTLTARRINISFLFRWMCPLLTLGLACIVWFPGTPGIPIALSLAARFSFCLITQMYFARIGGNGAVSATQAFGLGWIFVHLGDLVGLTFSLWLTGVFPSAPLPLANICFGAVLLLIVVAMFVTNDLDNFSLHAGLPAAKVPTGPAQDEANNDETRPRDAFDVRVHDMMSAHQLTPREREICMLLAQGRSIPYIRDALVISRDTVSTHVKHIYTKLDVHSRQELLDLVQR